MMSLYTRRGDDGRTSLLSGPRVRKDDSRVAACGIVDELNAVVGWVIAGCDRKAAVARLRQVQEDLFCVGATLAALPPATKPREKRSARRLPFVNAEHVARLERWIDEAWDALPPLRAFVLPGGTETAARLHVARAVCRRAERAVVVIAGRGKARHARVYLNRLGDLLFAWARQANYLGGAVEIEWKPRRRT